MVYTALMKQLLVKIDDELHAQLEKFPNKSETVRLAIISYLEAGPSDDHKACLTKEEVLDFIKSEMGRVPTTQNSSTPFVPRPPDPTTGYPCCMNQAPCKHWTFNGAEGQWKNELTGNTREVL